MRPTFSRKYVSNSRFANTVFGSKLLFEDSAVGVSDTNFAYLGFGKFRIALAVIVATLLNHIGHVIGMCTKEQMGRIYTLPIVAAMANIHTLWDSAVVQFVTVAVRSGLFTVNGYQAVAAADIGALPLPTIVGAVLGDVIPEPFYSGRAIRVVPHDEACGLPFNSTVFGVRFFGGLSRLTAAAFAKVYGSVVRGIMGLHVESPFDVPSPRVLVAPLGHLIAYLHYTPFRQSTQAIGGCA